MANRSDRLVEILDDFVDASRDVEAAAVVSLDGLPMASALPDHMEEDRLGAMSAALLSLGEQAAAGLGRGALSQVFVEGAGGYVFLMSARDQAVLAVVTRHEAKIGLMLYQMRHAADEVGRVLGPAASRPAEDAGGLDRPAPGGLSTDPAPAPAGNGAGGGEGLTVPGPPAGEDTARHEEVTTGYGDVTSLTP